MKKRGTSYGDNFTILVGQTIKEVWQDELGRIVLELQNGEVYTVQQQYTQNEPALLRTP